MAERNNLLTRQVMDTPAEGSWMYVVYDGRDYRLSLAMLLSLVTKQRLGLDRVDNTADIDKPISTLTQQALDAKADRDSVVSLEAFNQLANEFQNYMTSEQINELLNEINQALQNKENTGVIDQKIEDQLSSVRITINQILDRLTAVEVINADIVTHEQLEQRLDFFRQNFLTEVQNATNAILADLTSAFQMLQQNFYDMEQATDIRLSNMENRIHLLESINCNLQLGPMDW